ncbi:TadE/TadG family type IV pilus assembly protein [Microbacterium sp. P07]|uniref:TadE/TadG family type IV pilus assembly protein n=1 Tax=Microbacterium sp. P07 TaxID=3366952 RepID=UPI003746B508
MRRWSRWSESFRRRLPADDDGSAAIEFVFVGLLLLVPIVYLVIALGAVQHQALGAESGARHIARAISTASDPFDADARAELVTATIVEEYGIDPAAVEVDVECAGTASVCPSAGATVVVTVRTTVALPLVPPILDLDRLARIPVEAVAVQKVSRFWGAG